MQDRDGGLANVYGVAVCPQLTFVLPGGRVQRELGRGARRAARARTIACDRLMRAGRPGETLRDAEVDAEEGPLEEGWVARTLTEEFPELAV